MKAPLNGIGPGAGMSVRQAITRRELKRAKAKAKRTEVVYVPMINYEGIAWSQAKGKLAYSTHDAAQRAMNQPLWLGRDANGNYHNNPDYAGGGDYIAQLRVESKDGG